MKPGTRAGGTYHTSMRTKEKAREKAQVQDPRREQEQEHEHEKRVAPATPVIQALGLYPVLIKLLYSSLRSPSLLHLQPFLIFSFHSIYCSPSRSYCLPR